MSDQNGEPKAVYTEAVIIIYTTAQYTRVSQRKAIEDAYVVGITEAIQTKFPNIKVNARLICTDSTPSTGLEE